MQECPRLPPHLDRLHLHLQPGVLREQVPVSSLQLLQLHLQLGFVLAAAFLELAQLLLGALHAEGKAGQEPVTPTSRLTLVKGPGRWLCPAPPAGTPCLPNAQKCRCSVPREARGGPLPLLVFAGNLLPVVYLVFRRIERASFRVSHGRSRLA